MTSQQSQNIQSKIRTSEFFGGFLDYKNSAMTRMSAAAWDLSSGYATLDEGAPSPIFGPFLFWPNGWMHQDATWYGGRPQPRELCVS